MIPSGDAGNDPAHDERSLAGHAVADASDDLDHAARAHGKVRVDAVVEAFGHRGSRALLLVPALLEISPIGGVPGVPSVLAATVIAFALQIVAGRSHMWLPRFVGRRCIAADRLRAATAKVRPVARRLDALAHGRLERFARAPFAQIAAALCCVLALTVPPLELLPFASSLPMAVIAVFALALLTRDGAFVLAVRLL